MKKIVILDLTNQSLFIDGARAHLSLKSFAVLEYLYQHHQQLVSKEDLLDAVWPNVIVSDAVLKVAIGELRKALGDPPKAPLYIETAHRRGYRFIGDIELSNEAQSEVTTLAGEKPQNLFGRDEILHELNDVWNLARNGKKQILFICAEAGLGKTSLLNAWFNQQLSKQTSHLLARTGCVEQHGMGEPYLPFFNALGSLFKTPQHTLVQHLLRQYAPGWYFQISDLVQLLDEKEELKLKDEVFGITGKRLLREFVDFIEALSQDRPVLLCIEDLHWCDTASLDLVMALAQRPGIGSLLLVTSLRPSLLQHNNDTLKTVYSQLLLHQQGQTLELTELDEKPAKHWIRQSLPEDIKEESYIDLLYRHTAGNPLLISASLDHLLHSIAQAQFSKSNAYIDSQESMTLDWVEKTINGGLNNLLDLRVAQLDKGERQLLDAASVSASSFATESVAAVLEGDVLDIEELCEGNLFYRQWLWPIGSEGWPDGSISECYQFWHQLYRRYFYENLSAARCRHYHLRFAERLLAGYQKKPEEQAAQLAYHFEAGRNLHQAIHFRLLASDQAKRCFAYLEAIGHLKKVMELGKKLDDTDINLDAHKKICGLLLANGKLEETITECRKLITESHRSGVLESEVDATLGLADALFWVDRQACLTAAKQAVTLSLQGGDQGLQTHTQGKYVHFNSVIDGYRPEYAKDYKAALRLAKESGDLALQCVHYPRYLYYLIIRSHYHEAGELAKDTMRLALSIGDAVSYLSCEFFHAWALFYMGRWGEMLTVMNNALALAGKNEHIPWMLHFQLQKAWLLLHIGDYDKVRELSLPIYEQVRSKPPSSLYFFSLIILLQLETAAQKPDASQKHAIEVMDTLNKQPKAIDWVLRLPLQQGLAEYWLQQDEKLKANKAAQELKVLSACSGEQTYQIAAEILLARCDTAKEKKYLSAATLIAERTELPSISWKLHAMQQDWPQSSKVIKQLLKNLESEQQLQACFKQSSAVQAVLTQIS